MLIAYDKPSGTVLFNSGTNSDDPSSTLIPLAVVQQVTGRSDLGILRLHDVTDTDLVAKTFTHVVTVSAGKLVVGGPVGVEDVPSTPVSPATAEQLMSLINALQTQQDALSAQQAGIQQQSDDLMLMMFGGGDA